MRLDRLEKRLQRLERMLAKRRAAEGFPDRLADTLDTMSATTLDAWPDAGASVRAHRADYAAAFRKRHETR